MPSAKSPPASSTARPAFTAGLLTATFAANRIARIAVTASDGWKSWTLSSTHTHSHRHGRATAINSASIKILAAKFACAGSSPTTARTSTFCINSDLHSLSVQPCMVAVLISAIEATFRVLPASSPTKFSIVPVSRAALSMPRPAGSKSSSIFSPGLVPRCCNTSILKFTCPRVTVNVVMLMSS